VEDLLYFPVLVNTSIRTRGMDEGIESIINVIRAGDVQSVRK
jgi:hypothetical protein